MYHFTAIGIVKCTRNTLSANKVVESCEFGLEPDWYEAMMMMVMMVMMVGAATPRVYPPGQITKEV